MTRLASILNLATGGKVKHAAPQARALRFQPSSHIR